MFPPAQALSLILENIRPLGSEEIPLSQLLGRSLASPVVATIELPPFDNSAMDGFAVRSADTEGASETAPVSLRVVGAVAAGDGCRTGPLAKGEALRIMTGAAIPDGADAVVPFEEVSSLHGAGPAPSKRFSAPPEADPTNLSSDHPAPSILLTVPVATGQNVRRAGEDVRKGTEVLPAGERITSRTVALLAALGLTRVAVFKRPRVRVIVTGSELVDVGAGSSRPGAETAPLQPGKIYNSNGPALVAALREIGIEPEAVVTVADTEEDLKRALGGGADVDVLITIGGVSAGDYDFVPKVLRDLGAKILFHKVAIKPGKPLLYAVGAGFPRPGAETAPVHIFALPGNPVSSWTTFDRFVRPALLRMMGALPLRGRRLAVADGDLKGSRGKEIYLRGVVEYRDGMYFARSAGSQGSANLLPLAKANAILVIPAEKEKIPAGEVVMFEKISEGV